MAYGSGDIFISIEEGQTFGGSDEGGQEEKKTVKKTNSFNR